MQIPNADRLGKLPLRADLIAQQRRLRELEDRVRKQNQAHWQQAPVKDDETEGWLLSYLDLLTLLLVMFVALLTLSGGKGDADSSADAAPATLSASTDPESNEHRLTDSSPALPELPLLVGSTALPASQWEEAGNLSWIGLMPGGQPMPVAPPLPFDPLSPVAPPSPEPVVLSLALDMPYTPVPALAALAPPRPASSQAGPAPAAGSDSSSSQAAGTTGNTARDAEPTTNAESTADAKGPSLLPDGLDLALLGDGIDVIVRERSVSFRISSELLFGLGQTDLTPGGQDVLKRVLAVMQTTELPITVEGHTDPIPIRNERFPSNWELSTARATSVLRRLIDGGIDPTRLRAIGYADTRALASNDTNEGRALNRRVEVILEMPTQQAGNEAPSATLQESP